MIGDQLNVINIAIKKLKMKNHAEYKMDDKIKAFDRSVLFI